MKKILVCMLAVIFSAMAVFAQQNEDWKQAGSLSFDVPVMRYNVKFDSGDRTADLNLNGFGLDTTGMYIYKKNNIALSYNAGLAYITGDNIGITTDRMNGLGLKIGIGAGYAFVNTDTYLLTLSLIGEFNENLLVKNSSSIKYRVSAFTFNIGADLMGGKMFSKDMGMAAGLRFETVLAGGGLASWERDNVETKSPFKVKTGGFVVTPRIGLFWML